MNFNFRQVFDQLGLNPHDKENYYQSVCPIHAGADNETALVIYKDTGRWVCATHNCHKIYGGKFKDFVRAVSLKRGVKIEQGLTPPIIDNDKLNFIKQVKLFKKPNTTKVRIQDYLSIIEQPSEYFLSRGYSEEILRKYYVGNHKIQGRPLSGRVLVPIFNQNKSYIVGCLGRLPWDVCLVCKVAHDPSKNCVDPARKHLYGKWKNSPGFEKTKHLYNMWEAAQHILYSKTAIITEGASCIWRLEECSIHNGVATFGASISLDQVRLLENLNINKILFCGDEDEAGYCFYEDICKKIQNIKIEKVDLPYKDLGEMKCSEIREMFKCL